MQTERLSHDVAQRRADREFQERFQQAQNMFQAAQAEAQRKFAGVQADLDRETQRLMQERGLSFDEAQAEANRELTQQNRPFSPPCRTLRSSTRTASTDSP